MLLEVEIPLLEEPVRIASAVQLLTLCRLQGERSITAHIVQVFAHRYEFSRTLGQHLDHHLGCPMYGSRDHGQLRGREPIAPPWAPTGVTADIEKWLATGK